MIACVLGLFKPSYPCERCYCRLPQDVQDKIGQVATQQEDMEGYVTFPQFWAFMPAFRELVLPCITPGVFGSLIPSRIRDMIIEIGEPMR